MVIVGLDRASRGTACTGAIALGAKLVVRLDIGDLVVFGEGLDTTVESDGTGIDRACILRYIGGNGTLLRLRELNTLGNQLLQAVEELREGCDGIELGLDLAIGEGDLLRRACGEGGEDLGNAHLVEGRHPVIA